MRKDLKILSMVFVMFFGIAFNSSNIDAATKSFTHRGCSITFTYNAKNEFYGKKEYETAFNITKVTTYRSPNSHMCTFTFGDLKLIHSITDSKNKAGNAYFTRTFNGFYGETKSGYTPTIGYSWGIFGISYSFPQKKQIGYFVANARTFSNVQKNINIYKPFQINLVSNIKNGKKGDKGFAAFKLDVKITSKYKDKRKTVYTKTESLYWSHTTTMK